MASQTAKNRSSSGSALLWAVIVLAVMVVFVGAGLTLSSAYHKRSLDQKTQRQAYFTARSVAAAVADTIAGGTGQHLVPENAGDARRNVPVRVRLNDGDAALLGDYTVDIERVSASSLAVTATAELGGQTAAYHAELVQDYREVVGFGRGVCADALSGTSPLAELHGDLYTEEAGTLTIDFPVSGSVFAPNAEVIVTFGGSVAGTVVAQSCAYYNTVTLPYQVVVVGNAFGVNSNTLVQITASDMSAIFQKPEVILPDGYNESGFRTATVLALDTENPDAEPAFALSAGSYYTLADGVTELKLTAAGDGVVYILLSDREVSLTAADFGGAEICFILQNNAKLTDCVGEKNGKFHVLCTDGTDCTYAVVPNADGTPTDVTLEGNLFAAEVSVATGCSLTVHAPDPGTALPSYLIPNGWRLAKYTEGAD